MIGSAIFYRLWQTSPLASSEQMARRWLSSGEAETWAELRDFSRRSAWLAGRILVKRILREALLTGVDGYKSTEAAEIEVVSRDGLGRSVRPRVFIGGRQQPWNFSLAHCDHSVFAAVSSDEEVPVGVDLVPREIGQRGFADFWLTSRERRAWRPYDECQSIAKIWAVKEATYKAIGQGEPFEPTRFEVLLTADGLTCCWNGPTPSSTPRIEVFDAGPHVAVMVAINKVLSENRA